METKNVEEIQLLSVKNAKIFLFSETGTRKIGDYFYNIHKKTERKITRV